MNDVESLVDNYIKDNWASVISEHMSPVNTVFDKSTGSVRPLIPPDYKNKAYTKKDIYHSSFKIVTAMVDENDCLKQESADNVIPLIAFAAGISEDSIKTFIKRIVLNTYTAFSLSPHEKCCAYFEANYGNPVKKMNTKGYRAP